MKNRFTTADCFHPISHQGGKIIEGAFISQTRQGNKYYTLIESHRWTTNQDGERIYLITNELFESDKPSEFGVKASRSEEHTSELQSRENLVCRLLLEKKKKK